MGVLEVLTFETVSQPFSPKITFLYFESVAALSIQLNAVRPDRLCSIRSQIHSHHTCYCTPSNPFLSLTPYTAPYAVVVVIKAN